MLNLYKFQNKEWQDELSLNLYDFGARLYDPAIVRTTTYDPLVEKFYHISPQSFLNNNPLTFIDPTGKKLIVFDFEPQKDGSLKVENGDNAAKLKKGFGLVVTDPNFSSIINPNTRMTRAINESNGNTAYDVIYDGKSLTHDDRDNYMCEECVVMGSRGQEISPENKNSVGRLDTAEYMESFEKVNSFDDLEVGKGFVRLTTESGEEHYVLRYGKSNDGTPYVF